MTNLADLAGLLQGLDQENREAQTRYQATIAELTARLDQATTRLAAAEKELATLPDFEGQRQSSDAVVARLQTELEQARQRAVELEAGEKRAAELQTKLVQAQEYSLHLQEELEQRLHELVAAQSQLEHLPDYAGLKTDYDTGYAALEARLKTAEAGLVTLADLEKAKAGLTESLRAEQERKRATDRELDGARHDLYQAERQLADLPDFAGFKAASDATIEKLRTELTDLKLVNAEFKKQAAALKKQTALAERHKARADDLNIRLDQREAEVTRLQQDLASLPNMAAADARVQAQVDAYTVALKQANARLTEQAARLATLEAAAAAGERAGREVLELRGQLEASRGLNRDLTERLVTFDSLVETRDRLEAELNERQRQLELADREIFRLSHDDSAARRFEDDRRKFQGQIAELTAELETVRQEVARQDAANQGLKEGTSRQETALNAYQDRIASFTARDAEISQQQAELVRLQGEHQAATEGYKRISEQHENLVRQHLASQSQVETLKTELGALRYQAQQHKEALDKYQRQLETTKNQLDVTSQAKETNQREQAATITRLQGIDRDRGYRAGQLESEVAGLRLRLEHQDDILRNMLLYLTRTLNQQKELGLTDLQIGTLVVEILKQKHVITGLVAQGKGS